MWRNKIRDIYNDNNHVSSHDNTIFLLSKAQTGKYSRKVCIVLFLHFFLSLLYISRLSLSILSSFSAVFLLRVLLSVPCFVAGTRDSRVNSYRAQRVSLRGLTLTHLRILLRISPYIPSRNFYDPHTYTHTHVYALPLSQSVSLIHARAYISFSLFYVFHLKLIILIMTRVVVFFFLIYLLTPTT